MPLSASTNSSSVTSLTLAPACARATSIRVPGRWWPKPWGRQTTPGRIASVTCRGTTTDPAREATRTA